MAASPMDSVTQVVVVGAGQAGLAAGFYLRRAALDFVLLDAQDAPGGAWRHGWESLRLFSPAKHSSLPGWPMPPFPGYPPAEHVVDYLSAYEARYELDVRRPVHVQAVQRAERGFDVVTDKGTWRAGAVINATGTWWRPFIPAVAARFPGRRLHTVDYRGPGEFRGQRVVVVGGGNSGAQIAADLAGTADLTWLTRRPPRYLPDEIDGRALFDIATRRAETGGVAGLGDIVAVPPVRAARDAGLLDAVAMPDPLDGGSPLWNADAIVWCTGFRPELRHLTPLRLRMTDGTFQLEGTRAVTDPRLHLLGYGDWTGPASATLVGVGPTARNAVTELAMLLNRPPSAPRPARRPARRR